MPILVMGAIALAVFGIIGGMLSLAVILERKASGHAHSGVADTHLPHK